MCKGDSTPPWETGMNSKILIVALASCALIACKGESSAAPSTHAAATRHEQAGNTTRITTPMLAGPYYLTWTGYDGLNDPENAAYILGPEQMGRGRVGFQQVIERLSTAPRDSILEANY